MSSSSLPRFIRPLPRRHFLRLGAGIAGGLVIGNSATAADVDGTLSGGKELVYHDQVSPNAEPTLDRLVGSWITPNELFYIRSHAPTPKLDPDTFELSIEGLVQRPLKVKLQQLRSQFSNREVIATMTCAGNRRNEHSRVKTVSGVPWGAGAIGNARWRGVPLAELLRMAGVLDSAQHVWFEGADAIQRENGTIPFGGSIPLETAMSGDGQMPGALIVHEMNGEPLTADHGFPIRSFVPGYIGARSVKWLRKLIVSDRPSENHYMASAYKLVTSDTDQQWSAAPPIGTFPINSVTCVPNSGARRPAGSVTVSGYALAPGRKGLTITRVDVSTDGGSSWSRATFLQPARPFCWRLWSAEVSLTAGRHELVVRATDSSGSRQPRKVDWNLKGYLFNAWHRTPITVES